MGYIRGSGARLPSNRQGMNVRMQGIVVAFNHSMLLAAPLLLSCGCLSAQPPSDPLPSAAAASPTRERSSAATAPATSRLTAGPTTTSTLPSSPTTTQVPGTGGPSPSTGRAMPTVAVGTNRWRLTKRAPGGELEGYTTRVSGTPGTPLVLKVSTGDSAFRVFAYRMGAYAGGAGRLVWRSDVIIGHRQPGPTFLDESTRTVVARWKPSSTVDTTGWPTGFYVLRLRSRTGWETQIPYIVSSPSAEGTIAMVTPVTTWQAYNIWGGYSLYAGPEGDRRAYAVSFDRPYHRVGGMNDFRTAVIPIVIEAEASGVPLSYFANVDLDERPGLLAGARGYVSMGHDEYWTPSMRRTVVTARDQGTNLAFLGANTMYWRIRLDDIGTSPDRLMTGYRHDAQLDPLRDSHPREATSLFRAAPAPMPENDLVGMLYECFPVDTSYRVVSPRWWGFRGTGARYGTEIYGLVGGESDRVYPNAAMPRPLQILSYQTFSCRGAPTSTQSVYYTTASGAGVFTAGTLRWGCALQDLCDKHLGTRTRDFARKVTANLLREFARGPVGDRHPARHNVDDFDLPLLNGVSAS